MYDLVPDPGCCCRRQVLWTWLTPFDDLLWIVLFCAIAGSSFIYYFLVRTAVPALCHATHPPTPPTHAPCDRPCCVSPPPYQATAAARAHAARTHARTQEVGNIHANGSDFAPFHSQVAKIVKKRVKRFTRKRTAPRRLAAGASGAGSLGGRLGGGPGEESFDDRSLAAHSLASGGKGGGITPRSPYSNSGLSAVAAARAAAEAEEEDEDSEGHAHKHRAVHWYEILYMHATSIVHSFYLAAIATTMIADHTPTTFPARRAAGLLPPAALLLPLLLWAVRLWPLRVTHCRLSSAWLGRLRSSYASCRVFTLTKTFSIWCAYLCPVASLLRFARAACCVGSHDAPAASLGHRSTHTAQLFSLSRTHPPTCLHPPTGSS